MLQFSVGNEKSIAFLDVLLIRTADIKIKTDWYHKPTFFERYRDYNPEHSMTQK